MIDHWFPTPIYYANLENVNAAELVDIAYETKEKTPSQHQWNCDTYASTGKNLCDDERLRPLIYAIESHVSLFAKQYGAHNPKCEAFEGWFNIASKGGYQEYHVHSNSHFSSVFYIKTPPNCGHIVFKSPNYDTDMFRFTLNESNWLNFETAQYEPVVGKLLIFRSFLNHMVMKNNSDEDRISIAMNWRVTNDGKEK